MPESYQESNYVFVCQKMHPHTGIYEIEGILVEDESAKEYISGDGVRKVEVFSVGKLAAPINTYSSLDEFEGNEE